MDLVWLVYGISLLGSFGLFFHVATVASACSMGAFLIYRGAECSVNSWDNQNHVDKKVKDAAWAMGHVKTSLKVFLVSVFISGILPSEKTAYVMVGAYATQKVAESGAVQETGSKVLTIINQKLDQYVQEGIDAAESATETKNKRK
jgi:hypothetical protein